MLNLYLDNRRVKIMNKKRKSILTVIVIVVIISTIVIGFTLYKKSVRHEEVKQAYDDIPCDEFRSRNSDRNAEFNYLYEQKLQDCGIADVDLELESYRDYGIDTNFPFENLETGTPEQLERVLQSCESSRIAEANNYTTPDGTPYYIAGVGYHWNNSTHQIDNGTCQFMTLEEYYSEIFIGTILEYCNSSHKAGWDNPYNYWFANQTHYLDSDICLWQNLDDGITLVLPTDWESVYIENHEKIRKEACFDYYKTNIWNDTTKTCNLRNLPDEIRRLN